MSTVDNLKLDPAETKAPESGGIACSSPASASSQLSLSHEFQDFAIEAQSSRHFPDLSDTLSNAGAPIKRVKIQESAINAEAFQPWVLSLLEKLLVLIFSLFLGTLGLFIVCTVLISIYIVIGKVALAALWVWKKVGLI